jgi:hypothetical protein
MVKRVFGENLFLVFQKTFTGFSHPVKNISVFLVENLLVFDMCW